VERPKPRRSKLITRQERAKHSTWRHQIALLPPMPWANTSASPSL
jgi:hypothetical protein